MKVTIKRHELLKTFESADIVDLDLNEYSFIILYLERSLERLEDQIKECKANKHLNEFFEGREKEHRQLKELIEKLKG